MMSFEGRVAVITGAASGIGRALARRCAAESMKIVLVDIERRALDATRGALRQAGASAIAVAADVSRIEEVERAAGQTLEAFGGVHLLFNNAGVGLAGPTVWESTNEDWEWILGVNLRGVVHGLRVFVPIMLEQQTECQIVNTSTAEELLAVPGRSAERAANAAVVALSESVRNELAQADALVKVSVVCAGSIRTRFADSARNRPPRLGNDAQLEARRYVKHAAAERSLREATEAGMLPDDFVDQVFVAIREDKPFVSV
jgi:NAD(P)-dependent dehydrogenase (short-subunit alcohol dehydrogenase family)